MGVEFCKGCEDCTNFKDNEGNLTYFANKPIQNLNNPFFVNGTTILDNSILNKTDFQNDISFLTNNNNNFNNQNKNEIISLNTKQINNDLVQNLLINTKYDQRESEDIFKEKKEDKNKDIHILYNNSKDCYFINNINDLDKGKGRLEQIKKNNKAKLITKLFKQLIEKKNESHKRLYTENSSINENYYIDNNDRDRLDVNLSPDQNYLYIGTKFNNKKDGLGLELFFESNGKYFGRFINNKRVMLGKFNINNNNNSYYYYGEIKGLFAYGFGYHENYKDLTFYEGMWKNSKKEGYGIEKYNKDNSIYKGYFLNGKKNGIGYYVWNDNSSYMGEWTDNTLDGYGIYHFADGSIYSGSWVNNRMNGLGEFTYPEMKTYLGYFERDKRTKFGILIWYKENKVFIGFWKDNKQNGRGKFISNGKVRYGIWENGALKEKIQNEENFLSQLENEEINYKHFFKIKKYEEFLEKIKKILTI